ncbi:transposase [Corynebacterium sp. ACRPQ]|uniref:transposase n=1 Tax=Corynebacterium sp. ACRPQ TaxID=2918201 RepID=UPI001EF1F245|nr:transposase [Corynebacterium sp. ACRPQ]MCG7440243.1 transposase [Corynebacterium sp. ACRPQ]
MSRYFEQFKSDVAALHENNEALSLNSASAELGINRASLHSWVKKYGTGERARINAVREKVQTANDSERIRQLEKENAKLREERDILRKATK